MIPILYEHNATDFTNHGIGDLTECTECKAKATSEGEYELSFTYPCSGDLYSELTIGRQIRAKVNDYDFEQTFRIYGIENGLNNTVTVNCQHISYDLASYPVKMFDDQISPDRIITQVRNNIVNIGTDSTFPFTLSAYAIPAYNPNKTYERGEMVLHEDFTYQCIEAITTPETFNATKWIVMEKFKMESPRNVREILVDGDNSILGLYGGDIVFNNKNIQIKKSAGLDRGAVIEYGIDLIDFKQDKNISEMSTGVLPYWKGNIRGSGASKTSYEVFTGDQFEAGYTYYTRSPVYTASTDTEYNLSKVYYILENGTYKPIEMSDLDFKSGLTYYEPVTFNYITTTDPAPLSGKTYYVLDNGEYRETLSSDLDFKESTDYYELSGTTYSKTTDSSYQWDKTYYLKETDTSGNVTYRTVDTIARSNDDYDLRFKSSLSVKEKTASGYERTTDEHYVKGHRYYLATTKQGSFIPVDFTDLTFKSGTTYYETSSFNYTVASSFDKTKVYYVSDTTEDQEKIVYGDIQYADGFSNKPSSLQNIELLDLSEFFEAETESQMPSKERLNNKAKQWMLTNEIGIPAIDLTVQYATLGQDVRLFDAVTVKFPKIGIETKAKVTSYTYDVLKERCTEIEVANAKAASAWTTLEDASRLRKGLLPPSRIGKKTITSEHIGTGEVGSANIASGGVGGSHIQSGAISNTKLAEKAITYNKIQDGTIVTENIKDGAITGTKVLDQAISLKKLDKDLQIFYSDVIAALQIYADKVVANRNVEAKWFRGDDFLKAYNGNYYTMSIHTHMFRDAGNGYIEMLPTVDWSGGSHPFDMRQTAFFQNSMAAAKAEGKKEGITEGANSVSVSWWETVKHYNSDYEVDAIAHRAHLSNGGSYTSGYYYF